MQLRPLTEQLVNHITHIGRLSRGYAVHHSSFENLIKCFARMDVTPPPLFRLYELYIKAGETQAGRERRVSGPNQ